jgi:hypothetical protein
MTDHVPLKDVAAVVGIFRDHDIPPLLRNRIAIWAELKQEARQ